MTLMFLRPATRQTMPPICVTMNIHTVAIPQRSPRKFARRVMTTKPVAAQSDGAVAGPINQFPEYPPRDDMQNILYIHKPSHVTALSRHFGAPDTTLVLGEMPLGWDAEQTTGILVPDLMVAFHMDVDAAIAQRGYAVNDRGKPPDFVLEVASRNTARNDETGKRDGYAAYGVPEYWRFDPQGLYYRSRLAGDTLVDGVYQPIPIDQTGDEMYRGFSAALNLYVCWERGQLRWYDPISEGYLLTHDEEADARLAAERERDAERAARLAAEERIRQLEAERE